MERIQPMNELQIQEKVEDLAGKSARILDCEQNTLNQTEEVLLVNGLPISLSGEEGLKIKQALIHGEVPPCDLVNNMLIRAGIEKNPVELETSVNVKSSVKTVEHSQLVDANGVLLDEKMKEKEDEDEFNTVNVEIWNTELTKNSAMGHKPGSGKNITQGKPDGGKSSSKKSIFSPSKFMKSNKSNSGPSGQPQQGGGPTYKSASQLESLQKGEKHKSSVAGGPSAKMAGEQNPNVKMDNLSDPSQKPQKNNKILSFFLKGKSKESKKSSQKPYEPEVRTMDQATKSKSLSIISPSATDDKNKKKKKQSTKNPAVVEPKYDNIVHSSAAIMSAHPKFKKNAKPNDNILDPALSLINVEIDGIPARVTYETFV